MRPLCIPLLPPCTHISQPASPASPLPYLPAPYVSIRIHGASGRSGHRSFKGPRVSARIVCGILGEGMSGRVLIGLGVYRYLCGGGGVRRARKEEMAQFCALCADGELLIVVITRGINTRASTPSSLAPNQHATQSSNFLSKEACAQMHMHGTSPFLRSAPSRCWWSLIPIAPSLPLAHSVSAKNKILPQETPMSCPMCDRSGWVGGEMRERALLGCGSTGAHTHRRPPVCTLYTDFFICKILYIYNKSPYMTSQHLFPQV